MQATSHREIVFWPDSGVLLKINAFALHYNYFGNILCSTGIM